MMSSKILQVKPLTYIPVGISSEYGASYATGVSMREMPTHMGSASGNDGGAEGLPEVQESVLEHATEETANQDAQRLTMSIVRTETLPQSKQRCQVSNSGLSRIEFLYEDKTEHLEHPDKIQNVTLNLPNGLSAKFVRWEDWKRNPSASEEEVLAAVKKLNERGIQMAAFQD